MLHQGQLVMKAGDVDHRGSTTFPLHISNGPFFLLAISYGSLWPGYLER